MTTALIGGEPIDVPDDYDEKSESDYRAALILREWRRSLTRRRVMVERACRGEVSGVGVYVGSHASYTIDAQPSSARKRALEWIAAERPTGADT